MKKISEFIVKARYVLLAIFVVLIGLSGYLMTKVNINYNILNYLDKDSTSTIALNKMEEEFGSSGQAQIMVSDITFTEALSLKEELVSLEGVQSVAFASSEDDTEYFILNENSEEGKALFKVFLVTGNFDIETKDVVSDIKDVLSEYTIALNGGAIDAVYLSDSLDKDMTIILAIAVIVVLVILLITSTSWIEPLIFAIVACGAILINMGSNILLNYIPYINNSMSFITKSIAAVMQLALAMDYSIILLNSFKAEKKTATSTNEALVNALTKSFAPISSSSITTVVGLLALMFMSFSIGFDVGLVLAKGIILSLLSVFLFMPALIMIFDKLIEKTTHRTLFEVIKSKRGDKKSKVSIAKFQDKTKIIVPVLACILIIVGCVLNYKSEYSYSMKISTDKNATINVDNEAITNVFGTQNTLVIMIPKENLKNEEEIANYLLNYTYEGENIVNSYQGLNSYGIYKELTSKEISYVYGLPDTIVSEVYTLMGLNENDKTTIFKLVTFMVENDVVTSLTNKLQDKVNLVNSIYTVKYKSDELAEKLNQNTSLIEMIYSTIGKEELTVYELLTAVKENNLIQNIFQNIQTDTIDKSFNNLVSSGLFTKTGELNTSMFNQMLMYCSLYENNIEGYDDPATYQNYKTLTTSLDKNAILSSFSFVSLEEALKILNGKDSISYAEVIAYLSVNQSAMTLGMASQNAINQEYQTIPDISLKLNKDDVKANYSVDDDTLDLLFKNGNIDNLTLFNVLSSQNYYVEYGKTMNSTLSETMESLNLALSMFESENYVRAIFNLNMPVAENSSFDIINEISDYISDNYQGSLVVSESYVYSQIKDTYNSDMTTVNLISFFAILIIIAITFKSLFIPILLTVIIQGSIWITMGISTMFGSHIFFVCYLVVMCIQMGATVDYAILITNNYTKNRLTMNKKDSIAKAMKDSIPTILTSGIILILATLIIGLVSNVAIVSELGLLLSRGCFISVLMIVLCLPGFLLLCDKIIERTTFKTKFYKD